MDVYILAIESSCDETSMAIVKNGCEVVSLSVTTQMDTHAKYGGVVPEIASRMHTEAITLVLEDCLEKAQMKIEDMDAVAVTYAPGLTGSLMVGVEAAKIISLMYHKPLIAVNHLIGHIYANNLENKMEYPLLALIVSGGHTELIIMEDDYQFKKLGETMDDAIGEAYDKVARVVGLPYPGGPNIERLAKEGEHTYQLPKPVMDDTYQFSYSGLKSAVINLVHNEAQRGNEIRKSDLARTFQDIAVDELVRKVELALKNTNIKRLVIAGGVSANQYLKSEMEKLCSKYNAKLMIPRLLYCTDNAAMIGAAAYPKYLKKEFSDYFLNVSSSADIA
ncbi:uGMP family protein [Mycoplasma sp. CAG:776]|nr:uGMP family protein [Mycoplasma sp. CAG:776]